MINGGEFSLKTEKKVKLDLKADLNFLATQLNKHQIICLLKISKTSAQRCRLIIRNIEWEDLQVDQITELFYHFFK